ncbi:MAG: TerC family protein [Bacteroidia bacterium]
MYLVQNFHDLFSWSALGSLLLLSVLEIVLGIDNIIFISIVAGKLPKNKQKKTRTTGLLLALLMRIIMLFAITTLAQMKSTLFSISDFDVTARDLILFGGGIFLLIKTSLEILDKIKSGGEEEAPEPSVTQNVLRAAVLQIVLIDIVFSFDSILTAVGLVTNLLIMILAVIVGMLIMIEFSGTVSDFINKNPTIKMLALAFLLMIGVLLISSAFHHEIPKGYIYLAMGFSLFVETLNIQVKKRRKH